MIISRSLRSVAALLVAAIGISGLPEARAHGEAGGNAGVRRATPTKAEPMPFGRAGDPKKVTRTIRVDMSDAMRFAPAELAIRVGETVRFEVRNSGKVLHEMVLGRMADLKQHAELMRKFPGMEHDEPHMAHVASGKRGTIVWQFDQPGEFHYGCLIPGHFEAGMIGRIRVHP